MIIVILVLIVTTFFGGLAAKLVGIKPNQIRVPLIFAGSFLFGITIIHILPEVFTLSERPITIGIFILLGFFFQQLLEHFTRGIEHGHFHTQDFTSVSSLSLLVALVVHSLLEGAMLTHDSPFHEKHDSPTLLLGIVLHKMPAAFALMTTMKGEKGFTTRSWIMLIIFSLASPIGLIFSEFILILSDEYLLFLFAIVSGGFLHISTTIFVETSPMHKIGFSKILAAVGGSLVAILAELYF